MYCRHCGKEVPEGADVCIGCGRPLHAPDASTQKTQGGIGTAVASLVLGMFGLGLAIPSAGVAIGYWTQGLYPRTLGVDLGLITLALILAGIALVLGFVAMRRQGREIAVLGIGLSGTMFLMMLANFVRFVRRW